MKPVISNKILWDTVVKELSPRAKPPGIPLPSSKITATMLGPGSHP
jgi:hypothetical protein